MFRIRSIKTSILQNNKNRQFCNESYLGKDLLVDLLLRNGSNPNLVLYNERTPLHESARWGELKVAKVLIKYGANPNIGGERTGWRPLQEAVKNGN